MTARSPLVLKNGRIRELPAADTLAGVGTAAALDADTDGTLAANSDLRVATQKAVKTYADQLIAAADAMIFKGVIDCSANPNYPAADRGWTYRVSVAGKIGGGSGPSVEVGDLLLCLTDSTASGTHGAVGASWSIAQTNLDGAVIGPASATDGRFAAFDGATGKLIKELTAAQATAFLSAVVGDSGSGGTKGLVPAPAAGDAAAGKFLKADGAFAVPPGSGSTGKQTIPVMAGAMISRTTNGPSQGLVETTTNKVMVRTLDYDQTTQEHAQFMIPMPKAWDEGTLTAQLVWTSGLTTGDVVWGVQAVVVSDDDPLDAAFGTAQTVTDSMSATASDHMVSAETSAITVAGSPAAKDTLIVQVYRKAADGSDTLAGDAKLLGIRLHFTTDASNDA